MVGIAAKAPFAPAVVGRAGNRVSATSELAEVDIVDAGLRQPLLQRSAIEVGMAARTRK
jgi:hypothetical protein